MKSFYRVSVFVLVIGFLSAITHLQNTQAADPDPIPALPGVVTERVYVAEYRPGGSDIQVASPLSDLTAAHLVCATMSVDYSGFPIAAEAAFETAIDIWETQVCSDEPITISATWEPLDPGILGRAGAGSLYRDFIGAPVPNTWYPVALANKYKGDDLDPTGYDIVARFNSTFPDWYLGTDGNTPSDKWDFVSVVLHEIGHGLGFFGTMQVDGDCGAVGYGCWGDGTGYPGIYDRFTQDLSGHDLISYYPNPSTGLKTALLGQVYFSGANANVDNAGSRVPLYSPNTWNSGSSYSHLDEFYNGTSNALMTFSLVNGETQHNPGSLMLAIFEDMGWTSPQSVYLPLILK